MGTATRYLFKSEQVLIKVPRRTATNQKNIFVFPDDQELRDKKILWIQFYPSEIVPKTLENQPIVNQNFLANSYLRLETYTGVQFVNQQPIVDFQNVLGNSFTNFYSIEFIGQRVNWPKCQVQIADVNLVSDTEDQYILCVVGYKDVTEEATKKMGVSFKDKK